MNKFLWIFGILAWLMMTIAAGVSYSTSKNIHSLRLNDDGSITASVRGGDSATIASQVVATDIRYGLLSTTAAPNNTTFVFDDKEIDTLDEYNSGIFTPKTPGRYAFSAMLCWTNWPSGNTYHDITVNTTAGTNTRNRGVGGDGAQDGCLSASGFYDMDAGDTLDVRSFDSVGGDPDVYDGFIKIYRVLGY